MRRQPPALLALVALSLFALGASVRDVWDVVDISSGKYAFLQREKASIGLCLENKGTYLQLRASKSSGIPNVAIVADHDGGSRLQVADGEDAVTVDLVKAAKLLNELIKARQ